MDGIVSSTHDCDARQMYTHTYSNTIFSPFFFSSCQFSELQQTAGWLACHAFDTHVRCTYTNNVADNIVSMACFDVYNEHSGFLSRTKHTDSIYSCVVAVAVVNSCSVS